MERVLESVDASAVWGYEVWDELDGSRVRVGLMNAAAGLKFGTPTVIDRVAGGVQRPGKDAPRLTGRELRVLQGLLAGLKYREIARRERISERTVEDTIARLEDKFGVGSRSELVACATEHGYRPV